MLATNAKKGWFGRVLAVFGVAAGFVGCSGVFGGAIRGYVVFLGATKPTASRWWLSASPVDPTRVYGGLSRDRSMLSVFSAPVGGWSKPG